ncbi:hypothetical protein DLR60_17005 [Vibrio tarriae]|nr:hypothetical protein DLR60_17005 [Vibrio tarriae]
MVSLQFISYKIYLVLLALTLSILLLIVKLRVIQMKYSIPKPILANPPDVKKTNSLTHSLESVRLALIAQLKRENKQHNRTAIDPMMEKALARLAFIAM